jgi:hypothetical protein
MAKERLTSLEAIHRLLPTPYQRGRHLWKHYLSLFRNFPPKHRFHLCVFEAQARHLQKTSKLRGQCL